MRVMDRKWWLTAIVFLCLAPTSFALKPKDKDRGCDHNRGKKCQQVPEGGSAQMYLLGAGITCVGAMFIRSRMSKPNHA